MLAAEGERGTGLAPGWGFMKGHGFGLGFVVMPARGVSGSISAEGTVSWGGMASTRFWIDPEEELIAVGMIQEHPKEDYFQTLVWNLVYQSIMD